MGKKNLDKLFQEKLKNFSELPDDTVWQSIETSLDQKKKSRKAIPLWWKLGGVAAVLTIGVFLWNPFEDRSLNNPIITDTNEKIETPSEENNSKKKDADQFLEDPSSKETQITTTKIEESNRNGDVSSGVVEKSASKNTFDAKTDTSKNSVAVTSSNKQHIVANDFKETQVENNGEQIATNKTALPSEIDDKIKNIVILNSEKKIPSFTGSKQNKSDAITSNNENKTDVSKAIVQTSEEKSLEEKEDPKKKSIFDEIAAQQEKETEIVENTENKWSAGPSVAPVYFDAIGQGSPVHSIFVPNSKSGDINLSYGLTVAYEVSKKLSIRSGIHKVDYGYNTDDIQFSSSLDAASNSQIDNVDYAVTARNLVVSSKTSGEVVALNQNPFLDTSSEVSAVTTSRDGTMEQQFGYVEVPVELNYALLDKKFGINLIGGVSSLFLVDNSIQLTSGELTTEVGEANNVNSVNFSTNVGFGINYKFTPKVKLNIEPMFKYQLNTFSQTEGTFQPFSVGVYSGLSFKF